jgi:3-hydroxyacyl-CoA dehydrogenase/enoyl-CoA hydratase/carnithine racemase
MTARARDPASLTVERHPDGLVVLTLAVPDRPHNVLTPGVLADLTAVLDGLSRTTAAGGWMPRGLVIRSGCPGSFCAGAEPDALEAFPGLPAFDIARRSSMTRDTLDRLQSFAWPSVAVIEGTCLAAGLELAIACDLRVAIDDPLTILGFPEVKLGLLPAQGGSVRLPRLIGPGPAIEMLVGGRHVSAAAASRMGLVDACVPAGAGLESARRLIDLHTTTGFIAARRRRQSAAVPLADEERSFLEALTAAVIAGRTGGHYPAPPAILRTVLDGAAVSATDAARIETATLVELVATPVSRELVRVFRIGERNRRDPGVGTTVVAAADEPGLASGVVGAGIMGAGIAAAHLGAGLPVTLVDIDAAVLSASVPGILVEAAETGLGAASAPAAAIGLSSRLRTATDLAALAAADIVIESVSERPDIKRQVLADIERVAGRECLIATNTSTNPITRLAEALDDPGRFCGMHFFNPVRRMTLVEVVRGPATADTTVARAVAHAKRLGKCPIVVRDSPGFLVNRVLMPYLHEAVEMVREGIDCPRIDRAARAFGMPLGPLELYDMIGLDTAFYAGVVLGAAYGDRIETAPVVPALVKSGRLGRKSGAGFYRYAGVGAQARMLGPDAGATAIAIRYRHEDSTATGVSGTDATIIDRLLLPMLLEALRTLDEGIVRDPRDVDLAMIHALGFPPFRGGLLAWAESLGAAEVVRRLEPLAPLGSRMQPVDSLLDRVRGGGRFTEPRPAGESPA